MIRRWVFVGLTLVSVFVLYGIAFFLLPAELLNKNPILAFGIPLFAGPFFISIVNCYSETNPFTTVLIGITPTVAASILLFVASQSPEGISGDGPIWLILLVVVVLGLIIAAFGSVIGAALRTATG